MHEIYQENTQPRFSSGTHVSFFCPTSTVAQQLRKPSVAAAVDQYLTLPGVDTPNSSASDLPTTEEEEEEGDNSTQSSSSPEISSNLLTKPPAVHIDPPPTTTRLLPRSQSETTHVSYPCISDSQLCTMASTADEHAIITVQQPEPQDPHIHSTGGSLSSLFGHSKSHHHKKPKTSLTKLKSSFIEYVTTHPNEKVMHKERASIFFNVGTNFFWMDYGEPKVKRGKKKKNNSININKSLYN
jgi:hypothetical protein